MLKIKKKDHENYVRMNLEGKFIEEKPKDMGIFSFFADDPGVQLKKWIDQVNELAADDDVDYARFDNDRNGVVEAGIGQLWKI